MARFIKKEHARIRRPDPREEFSQRFCLEYFIITSRMF